MRNDRMQEGSTAVALAMVTPGYDQDPSSGVADYASHQDQAQFEADKRAVYKHPLFPLLALLFERCEQATQSSDNSNSESFNMDIQAFVQHQERDRKPCLINDPEIDGLMIKAIQVLRIHLLELEKVQELCKDFCNRYITCLKGKMQSENLLRSDYSHHGGHDGLAPSSGSNGSSPLQVLSSTGNDVEPGANRFRVSRAQEDFAQTLRHHHQYGDESQRPSRSSSSSRHLLRDDHDDDQRPDDSPSAVHGSTPLSQIGSHLSTSVNDMYLGHGSPLSMQSEDDEDSCNYSEASGIGSFGSSNRKNKPKRGVLPKHATNIMRVWLFEHLVHPYPTEDEKRQMVLATGLNILQVNNWFINARRRIIQPMLDSAGATDAALQQHQRANSSNLSSGNLRQQQQRSKQLVNNGNSGDNKSQPGWQSDDSGSETNGSSDLEAAYQVRTGNLLARNRDDDEADGGGIICEDTKPIVH